MAENGTSDIEAYVVARFAEWAGDLKYSRSRYAAFAGQGQYRSFPEHFDGPWDVIQFVATLRAARLGEQSLTSSRGLALKVFPPDRGDEGLEPPEPLILRPTPNLRGVVHRVGTRDFEMRGFLSNPRYEERLYAMAAKLGATTPERQIAEDSPEKRGAYPSPGASWVVEGVLFQQVHVSDFGLIKSRARWTRIEPPKDSQEIVAPFQRVLDELDPTQVASVDNA